MREDGGLGLMIYGMNNWDYNEDLLQLWMWLYNYVNMLNNPILLYIHFAYITS